MAIFASRPPKRGLFGASTTDKAKPIAKKQLDGSEIAKLFKKTAEAKQNLAPSGLQVTEIHDRNEISALRGALYKRR